MKSIKNLYLTLISKTTSKWQIKVLFIFIGFIIIISAVIYTNYMVNQLVEKEKQILNFYASMMKQYFLMEVNSEDLLFLTFEFAPALTFPVIITDDNDNPLYYTNPDNTIDYRIYTRNIDIDTLLSAEQQLKVLKKYIEKMKKSYTPIIITDYDNKPIMKFYYYHSNVIEQLKIFPLIEAIAVAVFVFVGYIAFSNIRNAEESKVWVGMAKEAAHQLGTPISSLLAWIEILKLQKDNPELIQETIKEMENDINRLEIVTRRFSKIGSMPEKKPTNLTEVIENTIKYFERRLPHLGKRINITRDLQENIFADINTDLIEWSLENLLKNSVEAIETKLGKIHVELKAINPKKAIISVSDNGKGMTLVQKSQAFFPGYTTKKRGWGLGLSLTKRIIENYHNGKIYIKESNENVGTTFEIELPILSS